MIFIYNVFVRIYDWNEVIIIIIIIIIIVNLVGMVGKTPIGSSTIREWSGRLWLRAGKNPF